MSSAVFHEQDSFWNLSVGLTLFLSASFTCISVSFDLILRVPVKRHHLLIAVMQQQ